MKLLFIKIFLTIFILLFLTNDALAVFYWRPEIKYPSINNLQINSQTDLANYLLYIFNFAILIGIIVAVLSLIYGGFLYLTSGDNPQQLANAKSQIFSAFLGLIIILTSHLLFTILNPSLTNIEIPETIEEIAKIEEGVKIWDANNPSVSQVVRVSIPDIQSLYGENFKPNRLQIVGGWVGKVQIIAFSGKNYTDSSFTVDDGEKHTTYFIIQSIQILPKDDGVYLAKSIQNSRMAGVYYKPYLFPNPEIPGDFFHPTWYLVAPWSFNVKLEYSTNTWPVKVTLYQNEDCTGQMTTTSASIKDITGNYKCINIDSCNNESVENCFLEVMIYAGKNYVGLRTSNREAGRNNNIFLKKENGEIASIRSIKIKTKEVFPGSRFASCPQPISTIELQAVTTTGEFKNIPVKCIILKPYYTNITFRDATLWFYGVNAKPTSFFYLNKSVPDLKEAAPTFNDKIIYIKFKNKIIENTALTDYGAILFEDPYYRGNFKIFISDRGKTGNVKYQEGGSILMKWLSPKPPWGYTPLLFGGVDVGLYKDNWGQVRKVSSAMVFSVANLNSSSITRSNPYCTITLYKNSGFNGPHCKINIYNGNWKNFLQPRYLDKDEVCYNTTSQEVDNNSKLVKFEDNVRSLFIDGNCLVALTELRPEDDPTKIEDDYPGNRSSVFTGSDSDLSDNDIGKCALFRFFNPIGVAPCASGIAIIPYDPNYKP